jgi:ssDNA-binding Zn-finger/Zn-ribbon topoisomerase 1
MGITPCCSGYPNCHHVPNAIDITVTGMNSFPSQGWVCPKCGAVMSPWTVTCLYCKPSLADKEER